MLSGLGLVTVWQVVGIRRSATRTAAESGRTIRSGMAKAAMFLGAIASCFTLLTMAIDLARRFGALRNPDLTRYSLERVGDTDLVFVGALNDQSVGEVMAALEDPAIEVLRVNSTGGLIEPAIRPGRHIRATKWHVMAEGQCVSACVILLAASPTAALYPGTTGAFHRPGPLIDDSNPQFRDRNATYLGESAGIHEEFEVASWAIEEARRHESWTPGRDDRIHMNPISSVYDPEPVRFVAARGYGETHADEWSAV
jgi:hypothetical protein